ncbi:hypothetical protein PV325_011468 [Microctonus aethiopoides]|nr:hypothetical protein PV325_011468 [Microctonus aethiopoides]
MFPVETGLEFSGQAGEINNERHQMENLNRSLHIRTTLKIPVRNVFGVAGNKVQLPCDIQAPANDRVIMVLWFKGDVGSAIYNFDVRGSRDFSNAGLWSSPAALGGRAFFVYATTPAHLSIDRLEPGDEGMYRCRVDYEDSPTIHQNVNLTIIVSPQRPIIRDHSSRNITHIKETFNEGSDVHLRCETRGGRPLPRLTWYLENAVIDDSYHYDDKAGLTINLLNYPKIGRQHLDARLICQANNTNLVPPQTNLVILDINLKPLFVKILTKESKVFVDKKYAVECSTIGSRPAAIMSWWKNNKQITEVVQNAIVKSKDTHILEFVPSIDDDGKYLTCRAENPSIHDSILEDKWRLDVQYQPVVTLRMGVTLNPDDIKEGDDVYFECIVKANPKAYKLAWFKDDKELKNNATAGIVLSDRSLVLQSLARTSAGEYKCLAANSEGKTASNIVKLQVMYTPVCKDGKSEVVVGALKQETVSLVCAVESHPEPLTFQWTFNNSGELVEVPQSRYIHVSPSEKSHSATETMKEYQQYHGSRLNYTPATEMDYGTVACRATNQVIAAGRPYPLHNCTAREMSNSIESEEYLTKSSSGLLVRCLEGYDGGLPIYSYQLEVTGDEDENRIILNRTVKAGPLGATFEITELAAGRSYRLFIYAVNNKGRSEPTILEPVTLKGVAMYTTAGNKQQDDDDDEDEELETKGQMMRNVSNR